MRSFEVPAIGACMLMEDTQEHREIFGDHGRAVVYFHTMEEMARQLRRLVHEPEERHRLASEAHRLVAGGGHTYRDRLLAMLEPAAIGASVTAGLS
jgi:spore maturation protein CgeB